MGLFRRFIADQSGVAAIEYGLIAGLLGTNVSAKFSTISDALT